MDQTDNNGYWIIFGTVVVGICIVVFSVLASKTATTTTLKTEPVERSVPPNPVTTLVPSLATLVPEPVPPKRTPLPPKQPRPAGGLWTNRQGMLTASLGPYVIQLGAGGCLLQIFGRSGQRMLGPPIISEEADHDRVVQAVSWGIGTLAPPQAGLQEFER
jgi:hypothetical protein